MPEPRTLSEATAHELVRLYTRGAASPVEAVNDVLARAVGIGERLNCFITLDAEGALEVARSAEAELTRQGMRAERPLLGVPVTVKDLLPTRGLRTTRGSLLLSEWVPDFDAAAVERLRSAGAVVIGKTNTSEGGWKGDAGNRLIGPTRNPWLLERSSGGSSGGAAAAVAAGIGPLAIGTDGAGSIRIPAAFCGVVGFKPSLGVVPYVPQSADNLAHAGPIARSVADAALLLDAIAGFDERDLFSLPSGCLGPSELEREPESLRIGWCPGLAGAAVEPEVLALTSRAARVLGDLGHSVHEVDLRLEDPHPILDVLWAGAESASHLDDLEAVRDRLDPGRVALIERGRRLAAADLAAAQERRLEYAAELRRAMASLDLLATPTVPVTAFALGEDGPAGTGGGVSWTPFTYPFNLTGQPAISIPAGRTHEGLPVGIQLVGRLREDLSVLRVAHSYEKAAPWQDGYRELRGRLDVVSRQPNARPAEREPQRSGGRR